MATGGNRWQQVAVGGSRWQQVAVGGSRWQQVAAGGSRWQQVAETMTVNLTKANLESIRAHFVVIWLKCGSNLEMTEMTNLVLIRS